MANDDANQAARKLFSTPKNDTLNESDFGQLAYNTPDSQSAAITDLQAELVIEQHKKRLEDLKTIASELHETDWMYEPIERLIGLQ